jgi:hypothetical protein
MRWERLWADLDAQADQWERDEIAAEAADRALVEHGRITLLDRLRATAGAEVVCQLRGGGVVRGRVVGYGADWLALASQGDLPSDLLPVGALSAICGVAAAAVPVDATGLVQRRTDLRALLRAVSAAGLEVVLARPAGPDIRGVVRRVGRDYLDVRTDGGTVWSVPLPAVDRVGLG